LRPVEIINDLLEQSLSQADEEFSIIGTVVSMASAAMESDEGCNIGAGTGCNINLNVTGCSTNCGSGQSVLLQFLVGGTNVSVNDTIELQVIINLEDAQNCEVTWNPVETLTGTNPITLVGIDATGCIASFSADSYGRARISVTVVDSDDNEYTRDTVIRVTEAAPLDALFTVKNENGASVPLSSENYSHPLGTFAMYLSYSAYNPLPRGISPSSIPGGFMTIGDNIETVLENGYGFHDSIPYNAEYTGLFNSLFKSGHTIGYKKITVNGVQRDLIAVIVRGTVLEAEWLTDLASIGGPFAFGLCAMNVKANLNGYISRLKQSGISINDPILLVTGHSMGAAVANIVAHDLNNDAYWGTEDVFSYTFASPTITLFPNSSNNIFNIMNEVDLVPKLPYSFIGAQRYGHQAYILEMEPYPPSNQHIITPIEELFDDMPLDGLIELIGLPQLLESVGGTHGMSTYLHWMDTLPENVILNKSSEEITWNDIILLSKTGSD
jgi:hypothetical protein